MKIIRIVKLEIALLLLKLGTQVSLIGGIKELLHQSKTKGHADLVGHLLQPLMLSQNWFGKNFSIIRSIYLNNICWNALIKVLAQGVICNIQCLKH